MADPRPPEFIGEAANLPLKLREQLAKELPAVFRQLARDRAVEAVTVSRNFTGYTLDLDRRVVLGVEVRFADGYETHIIKVGSADAVRRDYTGWRECTSGRVIGSRVFAPVRLADALPDRSRCAVLYQDAYTLFGVNREKDQPRSLEEVVKEAVVGGETDPLSVERAIAHTYTDLGRWFYPGASTDQTAAARFYRGHLGVGDPESGKRVLEQWESDTRPALRRDAVWVLSGRERPVAEPGPVRYLDPVEFMAWALQKPESSWVPDTLVGPAHGDLHARNVLLGVRRGEAEYPAVFDYGEMSQANVLAWDFAKLEGELTRVLLPPLLTNPVVRGELAEKTGLRPKPTREAGPPTEAAERADQLRAFLRFHELLHELTARVKDPSGAEIIRPLPHPPTRSEPVNRLLAIILRIRKEAALWLGFESPGRQYVWRDEYYFALAVQGLLNAKARWNYFPSQIECALVSAGVAVARMGETATLLRNAAAAGPAAAGPFPSYRVPLAILHNLWAAGQRQEATDYAERVAVEPPDPVSPLRVRASARHAVPLQAEAILVQMEAGRAGPAEGLLNQELRPLAREFGDFETLGRLGRLFKEAGDRKWHESQLPFDHFRDSPGWQMYRYAQSVYAEAYEATEDRYVGINAATLALLTHDTEAATRYAAQIARSCADQHDTVKQDRYWLFATEGEASLVRGRPGVGDIPDAVHFYREALAELTPGQGAMANSSYRQLCRLWKALGAERVVPLLELFEAHPIARPALSIGFLGRQAAPPVVPSPSAGDS